MIEAIQKPKQQKTVAIPDLILLLMFVLSALTGTVNQMILSLGIVVCCGLLMMFDKLYLAYPFVLFYNSFFGLVFGFSVSRIFSLLVVLNLILRFSGRLTLKVQYLPVFLLYLIYIVTVMMSAIGMFSAAYILLDIFCCIFIVNDLTKKENAIRDFFRVYTVVCLLSFLSGMVAANYIGGKYDYSRFMATFEDPNYMGFFFTVAVFAIVTLKLFSPKIRVLLVVVLYAMMLASLSMTAILVNIILWFVYLAITRRLKVTVFFAFAAIALLLFGLYQYGLANEDAPVLGQLAARINEKLLSLGSGDLGSVTTGRSNLAVEHFKYFLSLPLLNILFGGIPVSVRYLHPDFSAVAHNEYVDMLLNVGVLGTIVFLGYFVWTLVSHYRNYKETKDNQHLALLMGKAVWACYALTLTMMLDYRFLFMFLI